MKLNKPQLQTPSPKSFKATPLSNKAIESQTEIERLIANAPIPHKIKRASENVRGTK
jgi:hypothetical protein